MSDNTSHKLSDIVKEHEKRLIEEAKRMEKFGKTLDDLRKIEAEHKNKPIKQNRTMIILMIITIIIAILALFISVYTLLN